MQELFNKPKLLLFGLGAVLFSFAGMALANPIVEPQSSNLFKLILSSSFAIVFGCLCFFLHRLNKRLQNNITNFNKEDIIDKAFQRAFKTLLSKITIPKDFKLIENQNITLIKSFVV